MWKYTKKVNGGFSLIEIMIVITILGILAAIVVPSYQTYVRKAKVNVVLQLLANYEDEIGIYYNKNGAFPADLSNIPYRTTLLPTNFPSADVGYVYWANDEYSPNGYLKGYIGAGLSSDLGGGIISIVPYVIDPNQGIIFSCGIWDGSYAGNSVQYFPNICNELDQANL